MKIGQEDWGGSAFLDNWAKLGFVIKAVQVQLFGPNLFSKFSTCFQVSKDGILAIDSFQKIFNWSIV